MLKHGQHAAYLLLMPIILLLLVLIVIPVIWTFYLSLHNTPFGFGDMKFVGLGNYLQLLADPVFWGSFKIWILWGFGNLVLQMTIPLGIALLLNRHFPGNNLARMLVVIPWIIPMAVIAILTRWMFEPTLGIINELLLTTGLSSQAVNFLGSNMNALPVLIMVNSWKYLPFGTIMILAVLQTIPEELYEAATVDGASGFQQFKHITFPLLGTVVWFVAFLAFAWSMNAFDLIWLTTEGGPGNSTMTLPVMIYKRAFKTFSAGTASAIAIFITMFLTVTGVFYFKYLSPKKDDGR
ncbi:MAG: carbohydrate ABC transporter permease [Patescibacteria group bacterium]